MKPGILQAREATPAKLKLIREHPKHNREVKALQDSEKPEESEQKSAQIPPDELTHSSR